MTNRFEVNFFGPDGTFAKLFPEGPDAEGEFLNALPYVRKLSHPAETADWVYVDNSDDQFIASVTVNRGWMPSWAIGAPLEDLPLEISAQSLAFAAVANELDPHYPAETRIAAEFLLALFVFENSIDTDADPTEDLVLKVNNTATPSPDHWGAFGITNAQWEAFISANGARLNWSGDFLRELVLPQMTCANWLGHRHRKTIGLEFGATPTEPFVARHLDLFMAHLLGEKAAAAVIVCDRAEEGLTKNIKTVVRDANSWNDDSPELKKLFENRLALLGPLTPSDGTTTGGMIKVSTFLENVQATLDPALVYARKMLDTYLPGFAVIPQRADQWMEAAHTELERWDDGGWSEQVDPGKTEATHYFGSTDYSPEVVIDPNTNELTHWCGAFVAFCMEQAGAPIPKHSATAASWRNWGDVSLGADPEEDVPVGAVVTIAGNPDTNGVGHVTLFLRWLPGGEMFEGLGGNQSDRVTIAEFERKEIVEIRVLAAKETDTISDDDLEVLAKTLYGEIRGGNEDQVRNIANVVLNRFLTGYRSDGSIAGTCLKPEQFSCWNPGTSARASLDSLEENNPELEGLRGIAAEVINTRLSNPDGPAPLEGARHYHNQDVSPDWAIPANMVENDGKHLFYKGIS